MGKKDRKRGKGGEDVKKGRKDIRKESDIKKGGVSEKQRQV